MQVADARYSTSSQCRWWCNTAAALRLVEQLCLTQPVLFSFSLQRRALSRTHGRVYVQGSYLHTWSPCGVGGGSLPTHSFTAPVTRWAERLTDTYAEAFSDAVRVHETSAHRW